jgi:hypothetical protein
VISILLSSSGNDALPAAVAYIPGTRGKLPPVANGASQTSQTKAPNSRSTSFLYTFGDAGRSALP